MEPCWKHTGQERENQQTKMLQAKTPPDKLPDRGLTDRPASHSHHATTRHGSSGFGRPIGPSLPLLASCAWPAPIRSVSRARGPEVMGAQFFPALPACSIFSVQLLLALAGGAIRKPFELRHRTKIIHSN